MYSMKKFWEEHIHQKCFLNVSKLIKSIPMHFFGMTRTNWVKNVFLSSVRSHYFLLMIFIIFKNRIVVINSTRN